jgi:hypothetical protein
MIKIINATYIEQYIIELEFSDNSFSNYDFSYLLERRSKLTEPLKEIVYFKDFFLELGAISWKNGLDLCPISLYEKAREKKNLHKSKSVA